MSVGSTPRSEALQRIGPAQRKRLNAVDAEDARYDTFRQRHGLQDDRDAVMLDLTHLLDAEGRSGTVLRRRLQLIDTRWVMEGRPAPSRDRTVRAFLRALHHEAALGPTTQREPLYTEQVASILDALHEDRLQQRLDVALLYLANATGMSVSALSVLAWNDLRLYKYRLVIALRGRDSGRVRERIEVHADDFPHAVAAVHDLRRQVGPRQGPVFAQYSEALAAPTALNHVLRRLDSRRDPWGWQTAAPQAEQMLSTHAEEVSRPSRRQLRDAALILLGFSACLQTLEAQQLRLDDIRVDANGLTLQMPTRRWRVGVPYGRHPGTCPVRAWTAWEGVYATTAPGNAPAFPGLASNYETYRPLAHAALSNIVRDRALAARIDGQYGFTSLRMGFIRSAMRADLPELLILRQAGLVAPHALAEHRRREQLISHSVVGMLGL